MVKFLKRSEPSKSRDEANQSDKHRKYSGDYLKCGLCAVDDKPQRVFLLLL
jgi:hypothetical protein